MPFWGMWLYSHNPDLSHSGRLGFCAGCLSFQWTAGVLCGLFVIPVDGWGSVRVVCHSSGRLGFCAGCLSFQWTAGVLCGLFVIPVDGWGSVRVVCHSSGRLGFCAGCLSFQWTARVPCGLFVIPVDGWGNVWLGATKTGETNQKPVYTWENGKTVSTEKKYWTWRKQVTGSRICVVMSPIAGLRPDLKSYYGRFSTYQWVHNYDHHHSCIQGVQTIKGTLILI